MIIEERDFTDNDRAMMLHALDEARKSLIIGDFPAGAVLAINGVVVGSARSSTLTSEDWSAHAELKLLQKYSRDLIAHKRSGGNRIELFASVEPCLMCFGALVFHRVDRIIYAAPDTRTGFTAFHLQPVTEWYSRVWPTIERGLLSNSSLSLVQAYIDQNDVK